jgi:hypothetical protein
MVKRTLGVLAVSALVISAPQALAFGTIRGLGQNAEHERITRQGLVSFGFGPATLSMLAGKNGEFGAVGAPDRPDRGLMSSKDAHCDGGDYFDAPGYPRTQAVAQEQLTACRRYIVARLNQAVLDAGDLVKPDLTFGSISTSGGCNFTGHRLRAKCNVLEQMGLAFHAAQDFYSHSNWIDAEAAPGSIDSPPGLNKSYPAPWLSPNGSTFPTGLISGCYEGFPESMHCDGRIRHATLNKDTAGTRRGAGSYNRAMNVAAQDTQDKWRWYERQLASRYTAPRAQKMLCVLKSDDPKTC